MLYKYFFACLLFIFTGSAASGISLDYYFGYEDTLRSSKYSEYCNSCPERCGGNYACLLGKCYCVNVSPQINRAVLDDKLGKASAHQRQPKEPPNYKYNSGESKSEEHSFLDELVQKLRAYISSGTALFSDSSKELDSAERKLLDKFLGKANANNEDQREGSGDNDSSEESRSEESNHQLNYLAVRPTLRHHVAHFCPNLDIARKCIRKCLKNNRPAFCGKDHVCYCGLKYGTPKDVILSSEDNKGQFADLYEKYFGPNTQQSSDTSPSDTASKETNGSDSVAAGIDKDKTGSSSSEESSESRNEGKEDLDESETTTEPTVFLV